MKEYKNPVVTVDVVLASIKNKEVHVLIRRRNEEYLKGSLALPGSILGYEEDVDAKAQSVLSDKLGIKEKVYLEQIYTHSGGKERDSRFPTLSVSYLAIIDSSKVETHETKDSSDIQWVPISKIPELAFDHGKIIQKAMERVRNKLRYTAIGFSLVPGEFTIPELRENFEAFLGEKLNATNFRTKLLKLGVLEETGKKRTQGKGQPAPLYKLNHKKLAKLASTETLFN